MKKSLSQALLRFFVHSCRDINWNWDGLTPSERLAIGSKETFEAIKAEASMFITYERIVTTAKGTPQPPQIYRPEARPAGKYEAVLLRCNYQYAEEHTSDMSGITSVQDQWTPEWCIFLIQEGDEPDEWECQGLYFQDRSEAMKQAYYMNCAVDEIHDAQ